MTCARLSHADYRRMAASARSTWPRDFTRSRIVLGLAGRPRRAKLFVRCPAEDHHSNPTNRDLQVSARGRSSRSSGRTGYSAIADELVNRPASTDGALLLALIRTLALASRSRVPRALHDAGQLSTSMPIPQQDCWPRERGAEPDRALSTTATRLVDRLSNRRCLLTRRLGPISTANSRWGTGET